MHFSFLIRGRRCLISKLLLTWRQCHNKNHCWLECRRLCPGEQNVTWWRAEGGTCSTRSGWEPAAQEENTSFLCYSLDDQMLQCQQNQTYLFAFWCGRVVTVVRQVPSEYIKFAGNNPPRVSHFHFVLWRQENSELAGRERRRRHCRVLPRPQPTQRAVRNLPWVDRDYNPQGGHGINPRCVFWRLTPRKPSLLFVIDSNSRGCILASKVNVSPLGSGTTSSSISAGGVIPEDHTIVI